jgi:hypothetical protein
VNALKLISKAYVKKIASVFAIVSVTMMISSCAQQRKADVESLTSATPSAAPDAPATVTTKPVPSPPGDWEQVSRTQRVLGTITDIQIVDGIVQFIDLQVTQNVQPVNNPVDYDFVGQTLHLTVDEKLAAAGSFQDKLKKGSSFLANFAQFAIPPKGEIVLASRFSYNFFFYEHNGSFTDTKGQPFDLKAEAEAAKPKTVPTPKMISKILYAPDRQQLSKPLAQIPYYRQGIIQPLPETVLKQFTEGHQPWLSNPVAAALVNCSNLISSDPVDDLQNKAAIGEKKIVIDPERIITEIHGKDTDVKVLMSKPGGIAYEITMYAPQGTEVLFVKQIIENTPSTP